MEYSKTFLTFDEQLEKFSLRGFLFQKISKIDAKEKIKHINYYKLTSYSKFFEANSDNFNKVDFLDILELYYFDRELRNKIFYTIEKIEISFKTQLAYYISEFTISNGPLGYTKLKNWIDYSEIPPDKLLTEELKFKSSLNSYASRNQKGCVEDYFQKYSSEHFLPLCILIEIIDFGMACEMYRIADKKIKYKIAGTYNMLSKDFSFYLKSLKLIRNMSAHNNILWCFKLKDSINKPVIDKINQDKQNPIIENNKMISIIMLIKEFVSLVNPSFDFIEISQLLINHFTKYPAQLKTFGIIDGKIETLQNLLS